MNLLKSGLLAIFTLLLATSLKAQVDYSRSLEKDLHRYFEVINKLKGFSGELLVAQGEQILFQEAIGFSSVEHNKAMAIGANYRIASITKTFTGALIAIAQNEQKLNIADKAVTYIPGLSDAFDDITIHQLLTHTSGLPHNEGIQHYWHEKSKLQLNTRQVIDEINKLHLLFEPGARMHYSSLGYYLLATILETVYQDRYRNILTDNILSPLGMEETGVYNTHRIIPGMTSGYHLVADDSLVVAPYRNYSTLKGAGDMHATSKDLLKWTNSFNKNALLNEVSKVKIFTPGNGYGFGWYIDTSKPVQYYHGGGTWGYSSYIALYPERRISIILLSNISTLPVESIANDIKKMVFGFPFEMPTVKKAIATDSLNLKKYAGTYISETNSLKLNIQNRKQGLFAQLAGNPAFEIYSSSQHNFFGKKVEIEIRFEVEDSTVIGLSADRMGQTFYFKKL